jgi:hypothetical protein
MGVFSGVMLVIDNIQIAQEILTLIAELDEFKGAWRHK